MIEARNKIIELIDQPTVWEVERELEILSDGIEKLGERAHIDICTTLTRLRAKETTKEQFRADIKRLTHYLLQTIISSDIVSVKVETPLNTIVDGHAYTHEVSVFYVNRAGLTMGRTAKEYSPNTIQVGEIDMRRDEETLNPILEGYNLPSQIHGTTVLLADPMNATGGSALACLNTIDQIYSDRGQKPSKWVVANIISAPAGVKEIREKFPKAEIFTVSLDSELTIGNDGMSPGFIKPGLGDAGDRQFGMGRSNMFLRYRDEMAALVDFEAEDRIRFGETQIEEKYALEL